MDNKIKGIDEIFVKALKRLYNNAVEEEKNETKRISQMQNDGKWIDDIIFDFGVANGSRQMIESVMNICNIPLEEE